MKYDSVSLSESFQVFHVTIGKNIAIVCDGVGGMKKKLRDEERKNNCLRRLGVVLSMMNSWSLCT